MYVNRLFMLSVRPPVIYRVLTTPGISALQTPQSSRVNYILSPQNLLLAHDLISSYTKKIQAIRKNI